MSPEAQVTSTQISTIVLRDLKKIVGVHKPEFCFQCARCTSGCTAAKVVPEYKPHEIVIKARLGLVDELLESGVLWYCTGCMKCMEFCPQDVAPFDVVTALKNLAVKRGIEPPKLLRKMAKSVTEMGFIYGPMEVVTRDFEIVTRESLGLGPLWKPYNMKKFKEQILKHGLGAVVRT